MVMINSNNVPKIHFLLQKYWHFSSQLYNYCLASFPFQHISSGVKVEYVPYLVFVMIFIIYNIIMWWNNMHKQSPCQLCATQQNFSVQCGTYHHSCLRILVSNKSTGFNILVIDRDRAVLSKSTAFTCL